MPTDPLTLVHLSGLFAIVGTLSYAIGDVLMLAVKADITNYPNLQPHAKLLSGTEKLVALPWWRLAWGGLVGVLATPLLVAGLWHLYYGLVPAGAWLAWPPVLLFGVSFILAPFVHGSFIYLGEYVQALNRVSAESQDVIIGMFRRFRQVLIISYGTLMVFALAAIIWFVLAVAQGDTLFPRWLAATNPLILLLLYFLVRRVGPKLTERVDGAGFSIAYLAFFILTTATLW